MGEGIDAVEDEVEAEAHLWSRRVIGAAAPLAAVLAPKVGRPVVMASGFAVSVVGFVLISRVEPTSGLWLVLLAAGLVSGGLVAVLSLITDYVRSTQRWTSLAPTWTVTTRVYWPWAWKKASAWSSWLPSS